MITFLLFAAAELDAPMSRVTVYADRAEITRKADVPCDAGTAEATLPPIPGHVDERSLRVELSGVAQLTSLTSRVVNTNVAIDPRKAALDKERDSVRARLDVLKNTLRTLDEREGFLDKLAEFFAATTNEELRAPKPPVEQWKKALDAMKAERAGVATKRLALRAEERTEQRKLARLEKKLSLLGSDVRQQRLVSVRIACGDQKSVPVTFAYVLSGARWWPEYDLRVDAEPAHAGDSPAQLVTSAMIAQSTGEDWKDVEIVLSTAQPTLGAAALVPAPVFVYGNPVATRKVLVQQQERRAAQLQEGGEQRGGPAGAELDDGGRVFTFKLKQRPSIPADGHPVWFNVDTISFTTSVGRVATPTIEPYVFRVAKQKNPASYPLLAGTAHVYRQRAFMGDVAIEYTAPGEPFEISLGIDETMRVERRPVGEINRSPSLLGSTKAWERHYRTAFMNLVGKPVTVELREAIPVSKAKDVTVEIDEKKTTPRYAFDKDRGFVTWQLTVEKVKEVDLGYTVRIPKEWQTQ